jgi:hypothetical protein
LINSKPSYDVEIANLKQESSYLGKMNATQMCKHQCCYLGPFGEKKDIKNEFII